MIALLAPDEAVRLETLRALRILDTPDEAEYDDLVLAAGALMDVPVAYLSLVDEGRQWFKAKAGFDLCESPRESAVCALTIRREGPWVVPDTTLDPLLADNPFVTGPFGLRFYAGVPIVVDGQPVGTLCCVDTVPREPSTRQVEGLAALARQASALMAARRQAHAFATAERRFGTFLDHSPAVAFLKDEAGRFRYVNRRFETMFDRPADAVLGRTDHDWLPKEFADACAKDDATTRATGPLVIEERVPVSESGFQVWQTHKFPIDIDGEQYVGGIALDVTALREAEARVRDQNEELVRREEALTLALKDAEDAQRAAQMAAARFEQLFDGLPVACFTYGPDGTIHEWNAAATELWGIPAEAAMLAPVVGTAVGEANREDQASIDRRVFAGETVRGTERKETMRDGRERWLLTSTFPLRTPGGTIVGAVGASLDVTQRRRAEDETRASEARFRTLVESLHEGLTVQDEDGTILLWNPSAQRIIGADITGANAKDGMGITWRLVQEDGTAYDPEEMPIPRALRTGVAQESVVVGIETAEGTQWLSVNAAPLTAGDGGRTREAVSSFVDITERKRMEAELRSSEELFRTVLESMREGLVVHDRTGRVVLWNSGAERILGVEGEALSLDGDADPRNCSVFEDGSPLPREARPVLRALATGQANEGTVMGIEGPDRERRWLSVSAAPVLADSGEIGFAVATLVDVTERKRMEAALRESEARFRTVVESLEEGLIVQDEERRILYWNRSAERILGIDAEQMRRLNETTDEYRIVNEDETDLPYENRPAALALRTGRPQPPRTLGVHMPDGGFRWLSVGAVPLGVRGQGQTVVSSLLDVTERYEQERRLREYSSELEAANARLEGLATTDGLTGLKNHRFFQDWLRRRIEQCVGTGMPLSIALLDVDRFKAYNDDFGHQAGDAVLRGVATALAASVRGGDLAARYGGEEFVLVLPGADAAEAMAVAERVREAVAALPFPDRAVTASFGVATLEPTLPDAPSLIGAADEALYRSKDGGRNRVTHSRDFEAALVGAS